MGVTSKFVGRCDDPATDCSEVPGATCAYMDGSTVMTFTRAVAAEGNKQRSLTPGIPQQVIFAHGSDGQTGLQYHFANADGQEINFGVSVPDDEEALSSASLPNALSALIALVLVNLGSLLLHTCQGL